jgi:hypothetical protein
VQYSIPGSEQTKAVKDSTEQGIADTSKTSAEVTLEQQIAVRN